MKFHSIPDYMYSEYYYYYYSYYTTGILYQ